MNRFFALCVASLVAACGPSAAAPDDESDPGSASFDSLAVQSYRSWFTFSAPEPNKVFVVRRAVDGKGRMAEYDLRLDSGESVSVIYAVHVVDALPVSASVTDANGVTLLEMRTDGAHLSVRDGAGASLLEVDAFLDATPQVTATGPAPAAIETGLRALRCLIAAQTQLGFIPPFLLNSTGVVDAQGVAAIPSDQAPLFPWRGKASILATLWVAAEGVDSMPGASSLAWTWPTRCRHPVDNGVIGDVSCL